MQIPTTEVDVFEWAFKGLVTVVLTIGGWMWMMLVKRVSKTSDDLAEHKLHVSDNYIKKDVVDRLHLRIDDMAQDIKLLLRSLGK